MPLQLQGPDAGGVEGLLQQHVRRTREEEQDGAPPRLPRRERPRGYLEQRLAPDLTGKLRTAHYKLCEICVTIPLLWPV